MKCKKDNIEMEMVELEESNEIVKAYKCPICDLVIYLTDDFELYRKMGLII